MTLRNNSESEAALKEWLMVTWPPAVARRFLFYISELEVLKKAQRLEHEGNELLRSICSCCYVVPELTSYSMSCVYSALKFKHLSP